MKGDIERAAQSLTDRVFPEYDGCFSKPFLEKRRKHTEALIVVIRRLTLVVSRTLVDNRPFTKRPTKRN